MNPDVVMLILCFDCILASFEFWDLKISHLLRISGMFIEEVKLALSARSLTFFLSRLEMAFLTCEYYLISPPYVNIWAISCYLLSFSYGFITSGFNFFEGNCSWSLGRLIPVSNEQFVKCFF